MGGREGKCVCLFFFFLIFIVLRIFLNKNEMVPISGNPHKYSENSF